MIYRTVCSLMFVIAGFYCSSVYAIVDQKDTDEMKSAYILKFAAIMNKSGGDYKDDEPLILNGRNLQFSVARWSKVLENNLSQCDELGAYSNNIEMKTSCKNNLISDLDDWYQACLDKTISEVAWKGAQSETFFAAESIGAVQDFGAWAREARLIEFRLNKAQEAKNIWDKNRWAIDVVLEQQLQDLVEKEKPKMKWLYESSEYKDHVKRLIDVENEMNDIQRRHPDYIDPTGNVPQN